MTTLTVLGSSGGSPTRTNPASGYLVTSGDDTIWLDAGPGTFMALAALTDPGELAALVISHIHVDHCSDLFALYGYLAYGPSGTIPKPIYVPNGAANHLSAFARAGEDHAFHTVLDLIEVQPGDEAAIGGSTVRFGAAAHSVTGLVTRVDTGSGSMAYSGDTGPGSDLVDIASGVDLLLCEAAMTGRRDDSTYPYHLTAGEAGAVASRAGVGSLVVTHFSTGTDPETAHAEAASQFTGPVDIARPGMTFEIGV